MKLRTIDLIRRLVVSFGIIALTAMNIVFVPYYLGIWLESDCVKDCFTHSYEFWASGMSCIVVSLILIIVFLWILFSIADSQFLNFLDDTFTKDNE